MGFAFIIGIVLLYLGSEALLRGGSSLALRLKINPLIVGLTIIAFSTSSPELVVSIKATLTNHGDISVGNVIGANILNVAGILGFCALWRPIPLKNQVLKFDLPIMFLAYFLFFLFVLGGNISRWVGILFVSLLIVYTLILYFAPKRIAGKERKIAKKIAEEIEQPLKNIYLDLSFILFGFLSLIYGGDLLVGGTIYLARIMGINEASIALSIVSAGTCLPEICCSLVALWRKKYDILVGNIIGSNIFNIFFVIGVAAVVDPIQIVNIRLVDLGMMFLTGIFIFPLFEKDSVFPKIKAALLLGLYFIYIFFLYKH